MRESKNVHYVTEQQFLLFETGISCGTIAEKQRVRRTFNLGGKLVVMTAAMGTGTGIGWECIWGYEVKPVGQYTGPLEPLEYMQHYDAINAKQRDRAYTGMKVKYGQDWLVFVGIEITFKPGKQGKQLQLF